MAEVGDFDPFPTHPVKGLAEVFLRLGLTVNEEYFLQLALFLAADVVNHLAIVAVAGERLDAAQFGSHFEQVAENGHLLIAASIWASANN